MGGVLSGYHHKTHQRPLELRLHAIKIACSKQVEAVGLTVGRRLLSAWTDNISSACSYLHALALVRYYCQCPWLPQPLLSLEQALHLSTHSMKTALLASAEQLNLNLDSGAEQGQRKNNQFNYIPVMMFGQACSYNGTLFWTLQKGGVRPCDL